MRRIALCLSVLGCLVTACSSSNDDSAGDGAALNRSVVCTAQQSVDAFQRMIKQPIVPPRMIGGADLAGPTWSMATLEDLEATLCEARADGGDETTLTYDWGLGTSPQLTVTANKVTHKIEGYQINAGYEGTLDFKSRPTTLDASAPNPFGQHTYSIGVGKPVLRDGQPWALDWRKTDCSSGDCWDRQATEMYDAMMYTFAPDLPSSQGSCIAETTCLAKAFSTGDGVFGVRPLGIYLYVPVVDTAQPAASTPDYLYGFTLKTMPFSAADMTLKLDAEGPVARASNLGDRRTSCVMKLGMPYQSFLGDCVQVMQSNDINQQLKKKLLGGSSRVITTSASGDPTGTWLLDVTGINPNFNSERFDEREPATTAAATELTFDIRASGRVLNEYAADGKTPTLEATGAVYREYARLVQEMLQGKFPIGAPECLLPNGEDPTGWVPAVGCTGMEQFVTPADPSTAADAGVSRMSGGLKVASRFGIRTALKAGDPMAAFCIDPAPNPSGKDVDPDGQRALCTADAECRSLSCRDDAAGMKRCADPMRTHYQHCDADSGGLTDSIFSATLKRVTDVLGMGHADFLPAPAQDINTYVKLYAKALVKYLRAAPSRPTDLSKPEYDALTPADADITLEPGAEDFVTVKYQRKLEIRLLTKSGNVQEFTYR